MRRRFDVRDYTVFYVGQNGQIREFKINDATAATTPQNLHT